jgi:hypothetical protein
MARVHDWAAAGVGGWPASVGPSGGGSPEAVVGVKKDGMSSIRRRWTEWQWLTRGSARGLSEGGGSFDRWSRLTTCVVTSSCPTLLGSTVATG